MRTRDISFLVSSLVVKRITYFDRIWIWVNTNRSIINGRIKRELKQLGAEVRTELRPLQFDPAWHLKIDLSQATKEAVKLVEKVIADNACSYRISRVEITTDWITRTWEDARQLQEIIEQSFYHLAKSKYQFQKIGEGEVNENVDDERATEQSMGTCYFVECVDTKTDASFIPVLYSSRTKLYDEPTAHFEYRLMNAEICRRKKIRIFQQLLDLDILKFMKANAHFGKKPSKRQVGRLIADIEKRAIGSNRGFEKCCDNYFGFNYSTESLQRILSKSPKELRDQIEFKDKKHHREMQQALFGSDIII